MPISASSNYLPMAASANYLTISASSNYLQVSNASVTYALLNSPTFTGTPLAPTATSGTNTTQIATTAFVNAEIANDAIVKSILDAKGDLVTATANDTPAILTAGSNGQVLMADSSATAGLRYVDPPANRNLVINGHMAISARGTSATGITGGEYYTADRWRTAGGDVFVGVFTQTVENDAPTGSGLNRSLKMLCTTAGASPAAGGFVGLDYRFEGQDLQRVKKGTSAAEQLTLCFWVKSNVTGTYVAFLRDLDNSRQVGAQYTVSASATWERKTITFPADTTGAFDNDNARSMDMRFCLAAGSNFTSGTLRTSWTSFTAADLAVGQTNVAAATNNYWQVTGVQLETGPVATPFEFEPYEATLRKCQRYYQKSYNVDVNPGTSTDVGSEFYRATYTSSYHSPQNVRLRPFMRAAPTITLYSTTGASGKMRNTSDAADVSAISFDGGQGSFSTQVNNASISASKDLKYQWVAEIEL